MDPALHSMTPGSSRKRPRENETESQRQKREKAAERQRRKRERDRNNSASASTANTASNPPPPTMAGLMGFSPNDPPQPHQHQHQHHQHPHHMLHQHQPPPSPVLGLPLSPEPADYTSNPDNLTVEEKARRDRVRAAARERQRKHRLLVKQRKLRELGLDMGNEIAGSGVDDTHHYRFDPAYQAVLPHHPDLQHQQQQSQQQQAMHDPQAYPQGAPAPGLGGQTFASTLLLSFSCAPLLKQHLLRTLHMSNEELASLEPVLAEAWERWDHARRAHYAEQAVKAGLAPYPTIDPSLPPEQQQAQLAVAAAAAAAAAGFPIPPPPHTPGEANEFRERFQRSLAAPAPFRSSFGNSVDGGGGEGSGSVSTPTSASGSTSTSSGEAIDPQLAGPAVNGGATEGVNGAGAVAAAAATTTTATVTTVKKAAASVSVVKKGRKRG